jgi:diaminopimelate decarboxylase
VAAAVRGRGLELRCEPGRALLDGCGLTVARAAFTKDAGEEARLVGLEMNRTQCRSTSDDFLVDPLLLPRAGPPRRDQRSVVGHLVGAYCIERELITWRRLRFPEGVEAGDVVVFPNTAGYLMHSLESRAHQAPLARNLVVRDDRDEPELDAIDV